MLICSFIGKLKMVRTPSLPCCLENAVYLDNHLKKTMMHIHRGLQLRLRIFFKVYKERILILLNKNHRWEYQNRFKGNKKKTRQGWFLFSNQNLCPFVNFTWILYSPSELPFGEWHYKGMVPLGWKKLLWTSHFYRDIYMANIAL